MKNNKCQINYQTNAIEVDYQTIISSQINDDLKIFAEIDLDILKENLFQNIELLELELEKDFSKSMVLYQLIFCFELYLKYKIVLSSITVELKELKGYSHKLDDMVNLLVEKTSDQKYEDIRAMIKKIRIENNNKIDLIKYPDFKYRFNESKMLFVGENKLEAKEKMIIKEVIECLKK
ncbi:MAG: hypothetical protein ACI4VL_00740 [Bacilli bacterium]